MGRPRTKLSESDIQLIRHLRDNQKLGVGEIAKYFGLNKGYVSRIVRKLVRPTQAEPRKNIEAPILGVSEFTANS